MKKCILAYLVITAVLFSVFGLSASADAARRYVKSGGFRDGSSWANATGSLQDMINQSSADDEIWIAAGTYNPIYTAEGWNSSTGTYPTTSNGPRNTFVLKSGVKIYGGFSGNEAYLSE